MSGRKQEKILKDPSLFPDLSNIKVSFMDSHFCVPAWLTEEANSGCLCGIFLRESQAKAQLLNLIL